MFSLIQSKITNTISYFINDIKINTNIKTNTKKINYNKCSHTYYILKTIIPPNSISMIYLNELIYNTTNNINNCCNPYCRNIINMDYYYGYDGYFCSELCIKNTTKYIHNYWSKL